MLRRHRRAHRHIWKILAVLLPAIIIIALVIRQNGPTEAPPVLLIPPATSPQP